ncbi:MAG: hypothetical protein FI725_00495 [SAR202 cluster bacterium]|nr:hypothetical protein [SAR202 cluster bacterium]
MAVSKAKLDRALNPTTVAVVGAKKANGFNWLRNMSDLQGKLYSVHVNPDHGEEIQKEFNIENYANIKDIPDEIDYVVVSVPRAAAPQVLRDCIAKNVGGVGMFTSGFAETKEPEGIELQNEITEIAREGDVALLGPNCMGLYNPQKGVRFSQEQSIENVGSVAFISQSGGHAGSFATAAKARNIGINKVISFGNGVVLENADYLEYLGQDDSVEVIGMYIEGLKDGKRFFNVLKQVASKKPVVIWKGGQTPQGQRATASHTGSLAESIDMWDVVIRQCGAIRADNLEETVDIIKALSTLPSVQGSKVGLIGGSGGQSVSMSDAFGKEGLDVPPLSESSYDTLRGFFRQIGASYMNPMDVGGMNREQLQTIMDILINDPNIDLVLGQITPSSMRNNRFNQGIETLLTVLSRTKENVSKPIACMLITPDPYGQGQELFDLEQRLQQANITSFPSYERAAKAMARMVNYYKNQSQSI